jgi:hypothetical protein
MCAVLTGPWRLQMETPMLSAPLGRVCWHASGALAKLRQLAAALLLRSQQMPDQRPFLVSRTSNFSQGFLQTETLNRSPGLTSTFVARPSDLLRRAIAC